MNARAVITRLLRSGWEVWFHDGQLMVRHDTKHLTDVQRQYLTRHKEALLAALDDVLAAEELAGLATDAAQAHPLPTQTATGACAHRWVTGCAAHARVLHCAWCAQVYVPLSQPPQEVPSGRATSAPVPR